MKVTPKSNEELEKEQAKFQPLPSGVYDFEVIAAEDTVSKAGNEMIKLTVGAYDRDGNQRKIFDYLMDSMAWKLKHCCEALGLSAEYESGEIEGWMLEGRAGRCKVRHVGARDGYAAKNEIADYIVTDSVAKAPARRAPVGAGAGVDLDDDIPFAPCWQ